MPVNFTGMLRPNEIFGAIYNMIISQQVFGDNIKGTASELVEHFRVDGTMYGDTKLYYATDALHSEPWGNDAEASKLLNLYRPAAPKCQKITISNFRQISLTVDNYLTKRAWGSEGVFSQFTSVMLGWIADTKRVYDSRLMNTYIGTTTTSVGQQMIEVPLSEITETGEAKNRLEAQKIAESIANLFDELNDTTRDYNDYGYLRSYNDSDLMIIMNTKWLNKITKIDLPTIFNQEGLKDKLGEYRLLPRYFGDAITADNITSYKDSGTGSAGKPITSAGKYAPGAAHANGTLRSLIETDYEVSGVTTHVFPGDELPSGATIDQSEPNIYLEDNDIICKIVHKQSIPFMSAFEVATSFFNPKSLTENHYLTWGYSDLDYLQNYPFITVNAD